MHVHNRRGKNMNKADLIAQIARQAGISKSQAESALMATVDSITESLQNDENVSIVGFGTFVAKHRVARQGRNPATGETIMIAAKTVPGFKPGKQLKEALNQNAGSQIESATDESEHNQNTGWNNNPWS